MIRLTKGAKPQVLTDNAAQWTRELLASIHNNDGTYGEVLKEYNKPAIKDALEAETHGKCMYCEGRIKALGYNHIEHIKPKDRTKFPELTFEWENLGVACNVCNLNKGEEFDVGLPYINPYIEDPADHFVASGAFVFHSPNGARGKLTEIKIQLNRKALLETRGDALLGLQRLVSDYHAERHPVMKEALRDQIWRECGRDKQFSFVLKAFAEFAGVPAN